MSSLPEFPNTEHHVTVAELPVKDAIDFCINDIGISTSGHAVFHEGHPNPIGVVTEDRKGGAKGRIHAFTLEHFADLRGRIEGLLADPDLTVVHIGVFEKGTAPEKVIELTGMVREFESEEEAFFGLDAFKLRRRLHDHYLQTHYHLARRLRPLLTEDVFARVSEYLLGGGLVAHIVYHLFQLDDHALIDFVMYHFYSMHILSLTTGAVVMMKDTPEGLMYHVWFGDDGTQPNLIFLLPFADDHLDRIWARTNDKTKLRKELNRHLGKGTIVRLTERHKLGTILK